MTKGFVLLVDDDREAALINQRYLEKNGFSAAVCPDGPDAVRFLKEHAADCIVLDVMMPGPDGFQIFPEIKKVSDAPVLFLSGRADAEDRIRGLSLGADDYITKPCSLEELVLRIEINIRKSKRTERKPDVIEVPPLEIRLLERKVFAGTEEVLLSNREYELLLLLAETPNETRTFEAIGNAINGSYLNADRQAVMMTASRLRKKLEQYAGITGLIETVWGEGYRLKA